MNLALAHSRARVGVLAPPVRVEVHLGGGLPNFSLVGLPAAAVRESRERVRSAIANAQLEFPQRRITVNLAPADLPKEGGRYDLAIALGLLAASGQVPVQALGEVELLGELALTGELKPVDGVLPAALLYLWLRARTGSLVAPILAVVGLLSFIGTVNEYVIASVMLVDARFRPRASSPSARSVVAATRIGPSSRHVGLVSVKPSRVRAPAAVARAHTPTEKVRAFLRASAESMEQRRDQWVAGSNAFWQAGATGRRWIASHPTSMLQAPGPPTSVQDARAAAAA